MATKPPVGNIMRGDGIRQGLLITPIEIGESEDFVIEWDGIATEAGTFRWWGDEVSLLAFAMNSGVNAGIQLPAAAGAITFNDAALGLVPNQHYHMKLRRSSANWTLARDALVPTEGSAPSTTAFTISNFYLGDGVNILPASGAMQNMSITRGGETFFYPMNEGQGSIIYNTDPNTGNPVSVTIAPTAPVVVAPDVINFVASVFGTGTLYIEWKIDGVVIPGENGQTYDRVSQVSDDGKVITAEVSDTRGHTAVSNPSTMTVTV